MAHHVDRVIIPSTHFRSPSQRRHATIPPLMKGEVVEGRIVRAISPSRAILLIKGKQLIARVPHFLNNNGVILFKVEQVSPECVLKLISLGSEEAGGLSLPFRRSDIAGNVYQALIDVIAPLKTASHLTKQGLPDIIQKIWSLLDRISLAPDKLPDQRFLQFLVKGSGLLWENKLMKALLFNEPKDRNQLSVLLKQDLKGLVLGALESDGIKGLLSSEGLTRFVDSLEQFQLANVAGLQEKGKLLLVLPMQWDNIFRFAHLLIDLPEKDQADCQDNENPLTLSLFLDMSQLGPIRVDCSIIDRAIRVCFLVCSEQIQVFVNTLTHDLKNQLERHGFSVRQITCRFEKKHILEETSFLDDLVDLEEHRVSVMI